MNCFKNDTGLLYPPFEQKVIQLQANCLARGASYWGTSGLRTMDEQKELYALGRTKRNVDWQQYPPLGRVVTNAKPGQSYHNFRLAQDFALDKDTVRAGLQPDWSPGSYLILGEEAEKLGLEWGGNWKFKDYPHVQVPLNKIGLTLRDIQTAYAHGGNQAVFKLLDSRWKP